MNRDSFNQWLDTCPTDGWRVVSDTYGFIHVAYGIEESYEWVEESSWSQFKLATTMVFVWWCCVFGRVQYVYIVHVVVVKLINERNKYEL